MNARDFGEIACKVLAVYVWVRGLQLAAILLQRPAEGTLVVAILFGAAFAILGWLVLHAWRLVPGDPSQDSEPERTAAMVRAAYSVLGLWLVFVYLPGLASDSWMWLQGGDSIFGWEQIVNEAFGVAIGLCLFLQVPGLGWTYRRTLAPGQTLERVALPAASSDRHQTVAFSVLGFYFLIFGGVGVLNSGIQFTVFFDEIVHKEGWSKTWMAREGVSNVVMAVLGLLLFMRSHRISVLWHRLQGASTGAA